MMSRQRERRVERIVIVGLIIALVMSVSGISLAATSAPQTLNTCTKINKHGVYGATKVVRGPSCPGIAGRSYFQQWVLKSSSGSGGGNPCGSAIATQLGYATGSDGNWWAIADPASAFSSACHPTGTLSESWTGGPSNACSGLDQTNATLRDSGSNQGTDINGNISNASDYWGIDLGYPESLIASLGCVVSSDSYSGDSVYQGF